MTSFAANARTSPVPWPWLAAAALVLALLIAYPPFRIVQRRAAGPASVESFEAKAFAARFWAERLLPAAARVAAAEPVLAAVRIDAAAAAKAHARQVGLGNAAYYFLRGSGRVLAVERSRLLLDIGGATVALRTGPVFGNVVRDGCGLLDVNAVPGLTEFNALSSELNALVEARVQPALRGAAVGAMVAFSGCAEAPETATSDGPLLTFVPISAEVRP